MLNSILIGERDLTLADIEAVMAAPARVTLDRTATEAVARSAAAIEAILADGRTVYGVNTGFGLLASQSIPADQLAELQRNLLLSHSAGLGDPLPDDVVRLILLLKIAGLARGFSGVRPELIQGLANLLEADALPIIPEKGSVGASGDLAPLAHMAAVLIGEGAMKVEGQVVTAREGLALIGMRPMTLRAKEGLALINGTQVSTALALKGLVLARRAFAAALTAGAMSVDAAAGSDAPFDPRIHAARGQPGQIAVARALRERLAGSAIRDSHRDCPRVQDPYCLRCQPQVMGAVLDLMDRAEQTLLIEAQAVTDNPLVFADTGEALSGGNFHAEPVAFAADILALALAEMGSLSERRTALLIDPHMSGLPAFLVEHPGLNSGFMIAQVTAAALVSENKGLAHPASVDSIPTSAGQEDHVSMATWAARRLTMMAQNTAGVLAVELLCAAQGFDFRRPLRSSDALEAAHATIRSVAPRYDRDRYMAPDLSALQGLILKGAFA